MKEVVFHVKFGKGIVKDISDGYVEVEFENETKKFQFPQAFGMFLSTNDDSLKRTIVEAQKCKNEKTTHIEEGAKKEVAESKEPAKRDRRVTFVEDDVTHPLLGDRAQTIDVWSEEEKFELVGYLASPRRVGSFEAEVPRDGRDSTFEKMFPGQVYRPIEIGNTPSGMPNKLSPQFRINFLDLSNCPEKLLKNMGKGNGSCVGRINKSRFVIDMVQNYGFRFGDRQDVGIIRGIAEKRGFLAAFERGYRK